MAKKPTTNTKTKTSSAISSRSIAKQAGAQQAWLFIGGDEYQRELRARELINTILPDAERSMALESFDGAAETVAIATALLRRIIDTLSAGSLFTTRQVLWVRNASFLDDGVVARGKDVTPLVRRLADIIKAGLPTDYHIIITANTMPAKNPLATVCSLHKEDDVKPWQQQPRAEAFTMQLLTRAGLTANKSIARQIVARAGFSARQLSQEITKLTMYLGERTTVTSDDVAVIVSVGREHFTWDYEDAVVAGNTADALAILRNLLYQKIEPLRVVNALELKYRHLLAFREALDMGWLKPAADRYSHTIPSQLQDVVANDRRLMNPVVRSRLLQQTERLSKKKLARANQAIMQTRFKLVDSAVPQPLLLENLTILLSQTLR